MSGTIMKDQTVTEEARQKEVYGIGLALVKLLERTTSALRLDILGLVHPERWDAQSQIFDSLANTFTWNLERLASFVSFPRTVLLCQYMSLQIITQETGHNQSLLSSILILGVSALLSWPSSSHLRST